MEIVMEKKAELCIKCGAVLTSDDIGAYKKFRDRRAVQFMCIPCFAKELCTSTEFLRERVEFLKRNGCLLFETDGCK